MSDPATLAYYAHNASRFTLNSGQSHSRHLDPFLDRLTPEACILELGCGAGRDAARMAQRGFVVDATDATPGMLRKMKERFGIEGRVMRFDQLVARERYDAVWAHACLLHVARADLPGILLRIERALRPGGLHFASFKLGAGEDRDLIGRWHNFPEAEWICTVYRKAGFLIENECTWPGEGADGTKREWIALTVRRPA
ncbi:class I SAM-dependent methyltransferase [Aurantiacibacter spongiae]|uniref:Class I SAM-dependent methyltransferase n=1 Tax=Aurantiacibacter spongiae TaxID=2488860 RepID=A0A3N5DNM8_9SPHN|nr:class I SAM-dependent methyltransferase [Aurantiacibacter spongiae]RPF70671.1 class I SAM-dependent methyltransferase [Aurantiacibacter spongiae]